MYYLRLHVSAVLSILEITNVGELLILLYSSLRGKGCSIHFQDFSFNSITIGIRDLKYLTEVNKSFGSHNPLWADVTDHKERGGRKLHAYVLTDEMLTYEKLDDLIPRMENAAIYHQTQDNIAGAIRDLECLVNAKKKGSIPDTLFSEICLTIMRAARTMGTIAGTIEIIALTHFDSAETQIIREESEFPMKPEEITPACQALRILLRDVEWADDIDTALANSLLQAFDPEALEIST